MHRFTGIVLVFSLGLAFSLSAQAYVGPTLGLGIIGTVIAVLAVALLSLIAFVVLPIRRMLKKPRRGDDSEDAGS